MDRPACIVAGEGKDMTQEDIHFVARGLYGTGATEQEIRFATLIAAAQREKVAQWMHGLGYATGHGDTIEDLLDHLGAQIAEKMKAEREACAKYVEQCSLPDSYSEACLPDIANELRARGNK